MDEKYCIKRTKINKKGHFAYNLGIWLGLLSVGSEVQVLFGTPANNAESLCFQGFSAFLTNSSVIADTK